MIKIRIDSQKFVNMFNDFDDPWGEIKIWCEENCSGKWNYHNQFVWKFELLEDAMAFKLRWL